MPIGVMSSYFFHFKRKNIVGFSRQGNSNSFVLSLFSVGHTATMPDRNNYANNDVGILYRLYLMYLMYVHNYFAQSVDSSERMIVMLCAYLNSFPYRIFIVFYFLFIYFGCKDTKIVRNLFA